jgi:hypothetical protein
MTNFSDKVMAVARAARSSAWVLEGRERHTDQPLKILFAGGDRQKDYFCRLAFSGNGRETYLGKLYAWQLLYRLRAKRRHFDLAVIEGKRLQRLLFQSSADFFVPLWLETIVDLPLRATNKGAKEDLRRIRKHQLTWELRQDEPALREFYDRLYLPTVLDRHGENTYISDYDELTEHILRQRGHLLFVKQGELAIAGVVILPGNPPRLWLAGIRDSSSAHRRNGAVGATYVFPARYLEQEGYSQMALGRTRGFFNDGVMQYKNKWNHVISGYDIDGVVLKLMSASPGLVGFLKNQPFASEVNGELVANLFDTERASGNQAEVRPITLPKGIKTRRFVLKKDTPRPRFFLYSDKPEA